MAPIGPALSYRKMFWNSFGCGACSHLNSAFGFLTFVITWSNFLLSPPSAWADTTQTRIDFREVALIGKAASARKLSKRNPGVTQQGMCLINPTSEQPLVGRKTGRLPKRASEMTDR